MAFRSRSQRAPALLLVSLVLLGAGPVPPDDPQPADLLLRGGPVLTVAPGWIDDWPLPTALAVIGDRIAWVGPEQDAADWEGPDTRVVELDGRALLPGFADGHLHLEGLGAALADVDLVGTTSYDEVVRRVTERVDEEPPGTWILGRGWDQNDWDDTAFPHHGPLSRALPDHPVLLERIDGHALLGNQAAMDAAGIDAAHLAPPGGRILRDADGAPTGVFIDDAMEPIVAAVPPVDDATRRRRVLAAIDHLHAAGITAIHDAGVPASAVDLYASLSREGRFRLRNHVMVSASEPVLDTRRGWPTADLTGDGTLSVRAIKLSADGALGSRGAALLADYTDEPGHRGLVTAPYADVLALARFATDRGWQLCTHAIGDRANRLVLDAYAVALAEVPDGPARRFRIEHAQVVHPSDIPRFAQLGVLPAMQAQHCTSDMPWAEERVGSERIRGAYAWRSLLDSGVVIPGGSDAPVERADPLAGLHAAITRTDADGRPRGGWYPNEAMSRAEALAHVTLWPAYGAFREHDLGSLEVGKLADLVVLSKNPLYGPVTDILGARVELTVFDGEIVWERGRDGADGESTAGDG